MLSCLQQVISSLPSQQAPDSLSQYPVTGRKLNVRWTQDGRRMN
ncbi:MAG: hypothetical protein ACM3PS_16945 [Syntrophothermus sp.]